jgi:hypothetical protein
VGVVAPEGGGVDVDAWTLTVTEVMMKFPFESVAILDRSGVRKKNSIRFVPGRKMVSDALQRYGLWGPGPRVAKLTPHWSRWGAVWHRSIIPFGYWLLTTVASVALA